MTSHFDPERFLGAVIVATFLTFDPANMERYLGHYLRVCDPTANESTQKLLATAIERQRAEIAAAIKDDRSERKARVRAACRASHLATCNSTASVPNAAISCPPCARC